MVPLLEGAAALGLAGGGGWLLYEAHNRADTITKENAKLKAENALMTEGEQYHDAQDTEDYNTVQKAIVQEQKPAPKEDDEKFFDAVESHATKPAKKPSMVDLADEIHFR